MIRHFKKEMAYQVQQGKKTATTRYKAWKIQENSIVVYGSRYKPIRFGTIKVNSAQPTTWNKACRAYCKQEGFPSPKAMKEYILKHKLVKGTLDDAVWTMEFEYYKSIGDVEVPKLD